MSQIKRKKGITEIEMGSITIKTSLLNRYRYNDLRKKKRITPQDFLQAVIRGLKRARKPER